jgi:hypothetical protein
MFRHRRGSGSEASRMTPPGRSGNFPVRYAHHACQRCTAPLEPVLPDYRYRWVAVRIESRPISSHLVDRFRDRRHHSATRRRPTDGCAGVRLEFHSHGGLVRPVRTQSQSAVQRKTGFAGLYRRARSALFGVHGYSATCSATLRSPHKRRLLLSATGPPRHGQPSKQ